MWRMAREVAGAALVTAVVLCACGGVAAAAQRRCRVPGADTPLVRACHAAVDLACPCAETADASSYRRCARAAIAQCISLGTAPNRCRHELLRYARASTCGRDGAVACCSITAAGRVASRIVDGDRCGSRRRRTECVASTSHLTTGCDAAGCVACGDGRVSGDEDCDPPNVGSCDSACRTDPCGAPRRGELDVACGSLGSLAATADQSRYLVVWKGEAGALLGRRYDAALVPIDRGASTLAAPAPLVPMFVGGSSVDAPSVCSDGAGFFAVWQRTDTSDQIYPSVAANLLARRLDLQPRSDPPFSLESTAIQFPDCTASLTPPFACAATASNRFAVAGNLSEACATAGPYRPLAFDVVTATAPTVTKLSIDVPPAQTYRAESGTAVAALGGVAVWTWLESDGPSPPPAQRVHVVTAARIDAQGGVRRTQLSSNAPESLAPPAIAAGTSTFLVAWAQGASPDAGTSTEVRGGRLDLQLDPIDADGGIPLAHAAAPVVAGPVVVFDGALWLVAWVEGAGQQRDLRAIAVRPDGSVLDASPRSIASDLYGSGSGNEQPPAMASLGDGRVLVAFLRAAPPRVAVRARVVVPATP